MGVNYGGNGKKVDENYLKALRILALEPSLSQRVLAKRLNMSLGKANFLLKSMISKGYVKAVSFKNSSNKRAYMYYLTSDGFKIKLDLAYQFLHSKGLEFEILQKEIEALKQELYKSEMPEFQGPGIPSLPIVN